jgi:hypothetical protein
MAIFHWVAEPRGPPFPAIPILKPPVSVNVLRRRRLSFVLAAALLPAGVALAQDAAGKASPPATASAKPAEKPAEPVAAIRIKAGVTAPHTDAAGVKWLADEGFADGDTIERPEVEIANTKTPSLYRAERYGMTKFSRKLPNGRYTVKLYFAETYEGIEGPGQRVFSFKVEGKEFKDFDVWVKAGGALKAYVETVTVDIADGALDIEFIPKVENPEINAIEILKAP